MLHHKYLQQDLFMWKDKPLNEHQHEKLSSVLKSRYTANNI